VQRVREFVVERRDDDVILKCEYAGDIAIEQYGLRIKGRMFEDVFGYGVTAV
jgi:hypothetical protein